MPRICSGSTREPTSPDNPLSSGASKSDGLTNCSGHDVHTTRRRHCRAESARGGGRGGVPRPALEPNGQHGLLARARRSSALAGGGRCRGSTRACRTGHAEATGRLRSPEVLLAPSGGLSAARYRPSRRSVGVSCTAMHDQRLAQRWTRSPPRSSTPSANRDARLSGNAVPTSLGPTRVPLAIRRTWPTVLDERAMDDGCWAGRKWRSRRSATQSRAPERRPSRTARRRCAIPDEERIVALQLVEPACCRHPDDPQPSCRCGPGRLGQLCELLTRTRNGRMPEHGRTAVRCEGTPTSEDTQTVDY